MKNAAFLQHVRRRMFELRLSHEKAAEYLQMAQPTFSRKLSGRHPFTYEEAEALKHVLGLAAEHEDETLPIINPRPGILKKVVDALPEDDQKKVCDGIAWALEDKEERLKPEGQEALRALRALG